MAKIGTAAVACMIIMVLGLFLFSPSASAAGKTLYVGGTMSLTGPTAENVAAVVAAYEDYVKYVNETKRLAPWRNEKWPADITLELLWRDDEFKPAKALAIYEELKTKGILVFQVSVLSTAMALKDRLNEDGMGTVSFSTGSYLNSPPKTIFTHYPLFTDNLAAIADWFKGQWKEKRKPRVAYLTADNAMGKSIEIPEMEAYLKDAGYEFVGIQYVPLVPVSPPTTQLMWLKQNNVDLALSIMLNPGAQPTIKEAVRLDMGPHLGYKITFGFGPAFPSGTFGRDMGKIGDNVIIACNLLTWDRNLPGVKFATEIQKKYHPGKWVSDTSYFSGMAEVMTQVEALRLALQKVPFEKLKPRDVLEQGFYKIKNLDTGDITSEPLTYGPGKIEGVDLVRVNQARGGKIVEIGTFPCRHLYKH